MFIGCASDKKDENLQVRLENLLQQKITLDREIDSLRKILTKNKDSIIVPVRGISLQESLFETFAEFQGVVVAEDMVDLRPELGGRILKIYVKEGDVVQPGQKLALLDAEQIHKSINEAEKALELANTNFERQKALWEQEIGSEIQFLQAKNQKEQLDLKLESLRAQLDKFTLTAPIAGTIDCIYQRSGDVASAAFPILRIVNNKQVKVQADISERFVGKFEKNAKVTLRFPAVDLEMPGNIRSIGQSIHPDNRTFLLVVDPIGENRKKMIPNLLARVEITLKSNPRALTVPTSVIQYDKDETYVWVSINNVARRRNVKTGESVKGQTEIMAGLQPGDFIITEGFRNLSEGDYLQVIP